MGISQQPERWHKCVAATKSALPMVVDRLFIDHFFSPEDRRVAVSARIAAPHSLALRLSLRLSLSQKKKKTGAALLIY